MRFGLVRYVEGHLPAAVQQELLQQAGCDVCLVEGVSTRGALGAQRGLLRDLKAGDELLVCDLAVLHLSTAELVSILRRFDQSDVTLRIVTDGGIATVDLSADARSLLDLLATNVDTRAERAHPRSRTRPADKPLTRYQIAYARELRRHGASLRRIGLLFQTPPKELARLLPGSDSEVAEPTGRDLEAEAEAVRRR